MRRILALFLPLLLVMSACSSGASEPAASDAAGASVTIPPANAEALASVKVDDQGEGKAPKVTFDTPLAITAESIKVVSDGMGEPVKAGQAVTLQAIGFNAEDGKTSGDSYSEPAGESLTFDDAFKSTNPLVYTTFVGAKVGSFIAYAFPGAAAAAGSTAPAQPAGLTVFQIESAKDAPAPAKVMSADDVAALAKEGKLPTATFDDKGTPGITIPKNDAPADLAIQVLTEGDGDVLKESDTISAFYTGWTWSDSKQFDSAYDRGEASEFPLKGVIEGWTKGLTGQKVGSTVLLTIPAVMAYGENAAAQGKPAGPLVFVVKIESKK